MELFAAHQALLTVSTSFNLFTDSSYVVGALQMIETVPIIGTTSPEVLNLFTLIQQALHRRQYPCAFHPSWCPGTRQSHCGRSY